MKEWNRSLKTQLARSTKIQHKRNEDQEGTMYSESIRIREEEYRKNQVIYIQLTVIELKVPYS